MVKNIKSFDIDVIQIKRSIRQGKWKFRFACDGRFVLWTSVES
jgi:hypothetical protein